MRWFAAGHTREGHDTLDHMGGDVNEEGTVKLFSRESSGDLCR